MFRSLISKRFAHCVGCGNDLVFPLSRTKKFPATSPNVGTQVRNNQKLENIYSQLSDSQRDALEWESSDDVKGDGIIEKHTLMNEQAKAKATAAINSTICKHCVMTREGTVASVHIPTVSTGFLGRLFHVIDALDFPLGVPSPTEFSKGDVFVINRCDLLVTHESQLPKLKKYVMDTFFKPLNISDDQVILTSAQRGWHLQKLSESFQNKPKLNYFIGPTNSGKTQLVHTLSGVSQKNGPTTWPFPFTTQQALTYKALTKYRSRTLMDTPSSAKGSSVLSLILPNLLRKVSSGTRMIQRDRKYTTPKIKAKSGQVVSIGGLIALEFPSLPVRLPLHVFAGIGGLAHTDLGHAFRDLDKVAEINRSTDLSQMKMRMHDSLGLKLEQKLKFRPWLHESGTRQSVVIKNMGFLQPYLFGDFPDDYEVTVWAPEGTDVGIRPEILPYL